MLRRPATRPGLLCAACKEQTAHSLAEHGFFAAGPRGTACARHLGDAAQRHTLVQGILRRRWRQRQTSSTSQPITAATAPTGSSAATARITKAMLTAKT